MAFTSTLYYRLYDYVNAEHHMSTIIGREGRMVWDNFPITLKYWMIEWDKPDEVSESWHGKAIISQKDLRAMMEERAKSSPIPHK